MFFHVQGMDQAEDFIRNELKTLSFTEICEFYDALVAIDDVLSAGEQKARKASDTAMEHVYAYLRNVAETAAKVTEHTSFFKAVLK